MRLRTNIDILAALRELVFSIEHLDTMQVNTRISDLWRECNDLLLPWPATDSIESRADVLRIDAEQVLQLQRAVEIREGNWYKAADVVKAQLRAVDTTPQSGQVASAGLAAALTVQA